VTTELTREELLVENERLLGALKRLGEAYQIREENFTEYIRSTKDTRARAERYRLAWMSARGRAAAHADEINDARAELGELRRAYAEVCAELKDRVP
jgi:hypothetical protein